MERTISVRGVGHASAAPDRIELSVSLTAQNAEYDRTSALAAEQLEELRSALAGVGFVRDDLRTSDFSVCTEYEDSYEPNGRHTRTFRGYRCDQRMQLVFPLDTARLAEVFSALAACPAAPEFSVRFTVKDSAAVYAEVLRSAAESARMRAQTLCEAAGQTLGQLLRIDHAEQAGGLYSPTVYAMPAAAQMRMNKCADVVPQDVTAEDTVTFVWELT